MSFAGISIANQEAFFYDIFDFSIFLGPFCISTLLSPAAGLSICICFLYLTFLWNFIAEVPSAILTKHHRLTAGCRRWARRKLSV